MNTRASLEWDVYALTVAPLPSLVRVGGTTLRAHAVGPIAAILASPDSAPASLVDALRRQHEIVHGLSNRFDPLLPVRFGTRMTLAGIVQAVRSSTERFREALEHVRGRQQMTVRLIGPPERPTGPVGATTGADYLQRRRALHTVPPEAAPFIAAVEPFVVDARVQPGRAGIRASVYHLVERSAAADYRQAAASALPGLLPWRATVTGPWAVFAFAPDLTG